MFWIISNYSLWAMEKTNFCILLFVVLLTSLCNSQYDDYKNDDYNEYYDYNNQNPKDYTYDYSEDLNDYYDQNLLAPPNPPPLPPIPPPISPPPVPTASTCQTTSDSRRPNQPCVFPFQWRSVTYSGGWWSEFSDIKFYLQEQLK